MTNNQFQVTAGTSRSFEQDLRILDINDNEDEENKDNEKESLIRVKLIA